MTLSNISALIGVFASSARADPVQPSAASSAPATRATRSMWVVRLPSCGSIIDDERVQRVVLQLLAAVQERELDEKGDTDHARPELFEEPQRRRHGAAGREQVVHREHPLARTDRVLVHRQRIAAVLELVLDFDGLAGQLPKLAHRYEPRLQL